MDFYAYVSAYNNLSSTQYVWPCFIMSPYPFVLSVTLASGDKLPVFSHQVSMGRSMQQGNFALAQDASSWFATSAASSMDTTSFPPAQTSLILGELRRWEKARERPYFRRGVPHHHRRHHHRHHQPHHHHHHHHHPPRHHPHHHDHDHHHHHHHRQHYHRHFQNNNPGWLRPK